MPRIAAKKIGPKRGESVVGRKRKFTQDQLVQAALQVMENEGFAALTIRSLGAQLKVSHSALYGYVKNIEELEAEALRQLASEIPMPLPGSPRELRKQTIKFLLILREVLLKHPGVLRPPVGSRAYETFTECSVQWINALTPFAASATDAMRGYLALVSVVAASAENERTYGEYAVRHAYKSWDKRLPSPEPRVDNLERLVDVLLPKLPKVSKAK